MRKVSVLLMVLVASIAFAAACSKSETSSSSTSSSPGAATDTTAASPAAMAASPGAMANAASSPLPIPLAKLPEAKVAAGDAAAGAKVFSSNCESCHGAGGKNGTVGPSLAGIGIKPGQVAYMVLNPAAIDKDSGMPKLPLTPKQVADVAAYVASLK